MRILKELTALIFFPLVIWGAYKAVMFIVPLVWDYAFVMIVILLFAGYGIGIARTKGGNAI